VGTLTGYEMELGVLFPAPLFLGAFRNFAKSDYWLRHVCLSVRPSLWKNSSPTGRIFKKISHLSIFERSIEKIKVSLKYEKN